MSIYKPVPLILQVAAYDMLQQLNLLPESVRSAMTPEQMAENIGRQMILAVAQFGSPTVIFKTLGGLGGPASVDEMHRLVRSIREAETESEGRSGSLPQSAKPEGEQKP